ncbi:MAG: M28 family peptidase [Gemmataceae bacterium]|nr:M28 family peptidase [Gemmataceae bacterium]
MPWRRFTSFSVLVLLGLSIGLRAQEDAIELRMRLDVTYLASDDCEGRGVGTKGLDLAADYIAKQFERSGLRPGGVKGTWFQPFSMSGPSKLEKPGLLTLKGPLGQEIQLAAGRDFQVMGLSGSAKVSAPLVFAGYGATAKDIGYDDYKDFDVSGKVVVVLRHTPRWGNSDLPFDGDRRDQHASLDHKQAVAETHKAAAVIVVNDITEGPGGDQLMPFDYLRLVTTPSSIPAMQMRRGILDTIFQSSLGSTLKDIEQAIDRDMKPRSSPLPGWTATLETAVERTVIPVKNVIGVLEGSGPLAHETIVIGAHYDHLGYGGRGSLAKKKGVKEIHHGADDNASGTAALMELTRRFGAVEDRQGRRLVFIAFSAEESGLLGSQHYCNRQPLFPLDNTAAMVNLDMVGRLRPDKQTGRDRLIVEGVGTAKGFEALVDKLNGNPGFAYTKRAGSPPYSDNDSFYRKKIPILFFWTDTHEDYHKPSDIAERVNVKGMRKIADLTEKVMAHLAADPQRPQYVKVASTMRMGGPKGPRLGIIPNYDEGQEGVVVGGLVDGGAAGKAGIKSGDRIVQIAGRPVTNISTYMVIMADQKTGRPLEVVVIRNNEKVTLKVTP